MTWFLIGCLLTASQSGAMSENPGCLTWILTWKLPFNPDSRSSQDYFVQPSAYAYISVFLGIFCLNITYILNCSDETEKAFAFSAILKAKTLQVVEILPCGRWRHILMVSCQKGPTRHAYAWQIGPFWQDTLNLSYIVNTMVTDVVMTQGARATAAMVLTKFSQAQHTWIQG